MKAKKIIITTAALAVAGAGVTGLIMNSKQAKIKRFKKRAGMMIYNIGTAMRVLSCQCIEDQ